MVNKSVKIEMNCFEKNVSNFSTLVGFKLYSWIFYKHFEASNFYNIIKIFINNESVPDFLVSLIILDGDSDNFIAFEKFMIFRIYCIGLKFESCGRIPALKFDL